ncbi:MAG: hypothetical protein LBD71_05340 [Treponema sp.]|jgi:hypothetical protein|nr:hypothetical protein [Treponema sp.]
MVNRFFLVLVLLLPAALSAQEKKSYVIDTSSGTARFIQRISWYPEEYASRYEVRVEERLPDGGFREILRESAEADYLDVSLPHGSYRVRIQAYDLFDRPAGDPPWINLEVLPALQPELYAVNPDVLRPGEPASLALSGRGFAEGSRVTLRNRANGREETGVFIPEPGGEKGRAVFASPPAAGVYDVILENPGGLSGYLGPLTVPPRRLSLNYYFSAGYKPMLPLSGQINDILESAFYPAGVYLRFGIMPFEVNNFSFGFETKAGWNYLRSSYTSRGAVYRAAGHFADLRLNAAAQMWLADRRLALMLSGGGGLASILGFKKQNSVSGVNVLYPSLDAGFSVIWQFQKTFFTAAGADFQYLFSADKTNPAFLHPFVGAGVKF